jgi:DNA-binding NtrC family response regulator
MMKPYCVLLVDDEAELVYTLAERLVFRGIDAAAITDGNAVIKILEQREYDIVILDVIMPGINGIELLKTIKQNYPKIQVLLQTGRGSTEEMKEGLREGAFDYLVKPVDIDTLIEKMDLAIEKSNR